MSPFLPHWPFVEKRGLLTARVPCRASVNRTGPVGGVLRHARRDPQAPHGAHEVRDDLPAPASPPERN